MRAVWPRMARALRRGIRTFRFGLLKRRGDVIRGHSDIWNKDFSDFLFRLVEEISQRSSARPPEANREEKRDEKKGASP